MRDLQAPGGGSTELVSANTQGAPGAIWTSGFPNISRDGRFVVFGSNAENLVPGDVNATGGNVFLRDRELQVTQLIGVGLGGEQTGAETAVARVSQDGRFVAFLEFGSTPLLPDDSNGKSDLYGPFRFEFQCPADIRRRVKWAMIARSPVDVARSTLVPVRPF